MLFEEIVMGQDVTSASLLAVSGRATVSSVFIGGRENLEQYPLSA